MTRLTSLLTLAFAVLAGCSAEWEAVDVDGDGFTALDGDCDELNGDINPGATELWYDGTDQDCDGLDADIDGDGYIDVTLYAANGVTDWQSVAAGHAELLEGDCWDDPADTAPVALFVADEGFTQPEAAEVNPAATDTWYDGVDQDCAGDIDHDQDGDGWWSAWHPYIDAETLEKKTPPDGGKHRDCVDGSELDQTFYEQEWGCDPDGTDKEANAIDLEAEGISPADINPDQEDPDYDGIDWDCSTVSLSEAQRDQAEWDHDFDGYCGPEECDDTDAGVFPDPTAEDIWYDCADDNCDGNDGDQDGDGFVPDNYASTCDWEQFPAHVDVGDCWDDPSRDEDDLPTSFTAINGQPQVWAEEVYPGAEDAHYDGVDAACDGDDIEFDADGDGYDTDAYPDRTGAYGDDCRDGDAAVNSGATETCSTDYDDNCDDDDNDLNAIDCSVWYLDEDEDGYGHETKSRCTCEADEDTQYDVADSSDCVDDDASINPGEAEITADEIDQDCDGGEVCYADADDDGYWEEGDTTVTSADDDCDDAGEAAATEAGDDCDDSDASINPGEAEITADEIDQDCDGGEVCYADDDDDGYWEEGDTTVASTDEDCADPGEAAATESGDDCDDDDDDTFPGAAPNDDASDCMRDADGDDYGDSDVSGSITAGSDCDDGDATINEGATEGVDDGVDQDCDGDELCYLDNDNDGYRPDATSTRSSSDLDCRDSKEAESSDPTGDCDDSDASISPGDDELCATSGVDDDCDGSVDESTAADVTTWYADSDSDGYGASSSGELDSCTQPSGYEDSALDEDCDDSSATTFPGAAESESLGTRDECMADADEDGYGDSSASGDVYAGTDCDDGDDAINPGESEITGDEIDQDCDGGEICYLDDDDDGYWEAGDTTIASADEDCDDTDEAAATEGDNDCDDDDASINEGATEECDGVDNDCDGLIDDDDPGTDSGTMTDYYPDDDGDGYGDDDASATTQCDAPSGYVDNNDDCDDAVTAIDPDADETCDGVDNDCDGLVDDDDTIDDGSETDWYPDDDGDGYGDDSVSATTQCDAPSDYVADNSDCDDSASTGASINPDATEVCDPSDTDEDCDGGADDNDPDGTPASGTTTYYTDSDGDGYGAAGTAEGFCDDPGAAYADNADDCDDTDADLNEDDNDGDGETTCEGDCDDSASTGSSINTSATETCGDGVDDDCDDLVDEGVDGGECFLLGDLVVSEFQADPVTTPDADGEWFEVYNDSGGALVLTGWEFTRRHNTSDDESFWVGQVDDGSGTYIDLELADTERVVFCYDDVDLGTDCDYIYGSEDSDRPVLYLGTYGSGSETAFATWNGDFKLTNNNASRITLYVGGSGASSIYSGTQTTIDEVNYKLPTANDLVDSCGIAAPETWPDGSEGVSRELIESVLTGGSPEADNDDAESWCEVDSSGTYEYSTGNHGTPGATNSN